MFSDAAALSQTKEKPRNRCGYGVFVVREAGVEPARPEWTLEPEYVFIPFVMEFKG